LTALTGEESDRLEKGVVRTVVCPLMVGVGSIDRFAADIRRGIGFV